MLGLRTVGGFPPESMLGAAMHRLRASKVTFFTYGQCHDSGPNLPCVLVPVKLKVDPYPYPALENALLEMESEVGCME